MIRHDPIVPVNPSDKNWREMLSGRQSYCLLFLVASITRPHVLIPQYLHPTVLAFDLGAAPPAYSLTAEGTFALSAS